MRIIVNGNALAIVMVCNAPNPPANSNVMATRPSPLAQNIRCQTGVSSRPFEHNISTTIEPESDEVTKNTTTIKVATTLKKLLHGNCSRNANSAIETSFCTISPSESTPWFRINSIAELPKNVIHINVNPAGTSNTPNTNSRMVRPRDTRAMNRPTKGAQLNHHPQ